jgi:hypothetical protein
MALRWKMGDGCWLLLAEGDIPVASVTWSEEWACYVDEKGYRLGATFDGARDAVEKMLNEKKGGKRA